ncbi:hypothetical protein [Streptomyces sp. H39-S7]|uniref:hypothetical protein n=1 Tax=Streptomyces sp. H39-S7 TaxID=3004357 RepID=UPI0022B05A36|nr:hypothetical protein [Streptomyces sp. H39-S7]MCZ4124943.1 hypothetical protein [Streptomyces sp. H39-S7]
MIGYVVSFLLGLGVGGLYPMLRRRRAAAVERSVAVAEELPAALREAVAALAEEVSAVAFDADDPQATPAVLKEHRAALTASRLAGAARTETDALIALHGGRAAMIRLDARLQGRPVPIDALPSAADVGRPQAVTGTGERYVFTGAGEGRTEVLIDRPEPGRPALLDAHVTGSGSFNLQTMTRTEQETDTGLHLLIVINEYHGRRYLPVDDATHLRVTTTDRNDDCRWSIRLVPLSAATALDPEHRGYGEEVLRYDGGPAVLTVQFQTDHTWEVRYVCQCQVSSSYCDCPPLAWPKNTPGDHRSTDVYCHGEGRRTLRLPRPGFLIVKETHGGGSWYLTTQPVDIPPPPPPGRRRRR